MSPTVLRIIKNQQHGFPPHWFRRDGKVHRSILQCLFWECAASVVSELCDGHPLPSTVFIERGDDAVVSVDESDWKNIQSELGVDGEDARNIVRHVLTVALRHEPPPESPPDLNALLSTTTLGLILVTVHLAKLDSTQPHAFDYQFRELSIAARRHLRWANIGMFEEGAVARTLFDLAGMRFNSSATLFQIPYRSYFAPLTENLSLSVEAPTTCVSVLPRGFFTQMLSEADTVSPAECIEKQSEPPLTNQPDIRAKLHSILAENERLRRCSTSEHMGLLLDPLLRADADPIVRLESEAPISNSLTAEVITTCTRVLRRPDVELYGTPNSEVTIMLPHPDYELDDASPAASPFGPRNRFCLTRRGLRLHGHVVIPARVIPVT
jgi:hypothetical protein